MWSEGPRVRGFGGSELGYATTMTHRILVVALVAFASFAQGRSSVVSDPPIDCGQCAAWNAPQAPFRVFGNTYYVGTAGLSAVLIASDNGLILLDGALPQSAPLIDQNIRALGFRTEDVRLIVNSHAHFDHAGAIAAIQRATGAVVASSPAGARALEQGTPVADDPQAGSSAFPPVKAVRVVADGETLRAGTLAVTAHFTPGHTPGSTTWTWQSCEGSKCLNVVYADSLNSVSLPGFRFTGDATHPSRVESFRRSIAKVAALPCDILLSVHPEFSQMSRKLALRTKDPNTNPFVDTSACRMYAEAAAKSLGRRIAEER
jgi:metallo-beta-lactamase class B